MEEEISETVPAWYNVVFFEGSDSSVTRSWVKTENLNKMVEPIEQPAGWAKIQGSKKLKMKKILEMAQIAMSMPREVRLDKFSFASLFKGKWGKYADLTLDEEAEDDETEVISSAKKKKIELVKTPKSAPSKIVVKKEKVITPKTSRKSLDSTPKGSKAPKSNGSKPVIKNDKTVTARTSRKLQSLIPQSGSDKTEPEIAKTKESSKEMSKKVEKTSPSRPDPIEMTNTHTKKPEDSNIDSTNTQNSSLEQKVKPTVTKLSRKAAILNLDSPRRVGDTKQLNPTCSNVTKSDIRSYMNEKHKQTDAPRVTLMKKIEEKIQKKIEYIGENCETPQRKPQNESTAESVIKTENLDDTVPNILSPLAATNNPMTAVPMAEKRSMARLPSMEGKKGKKKFVKPPLPSDVLIALAVRNLDPENHYGAKFSSIQAFLSLHFPYFNEQKMECREMIRRAYDINSKEETGKENFRIKGSLGEQVRGTLCLCPHICPSVERENQELCRP